ncbi:MAG TPA: hypothetical protein VM076_12805 [Gemmatimonadaceae bacterium]|nr:hypothetical protein [Gemmatimonadaceae bacterium]
MRDHVRFHSVEFTPADAEPGQINIERYGYTLAMWVAGRLKERGFEVDQPIPEDWGWLLGAQNDGQIVRIGCGNVDGSVTEWLIWMDVLRPGVLSRLFGRRGAEPNAVYGVAAAIHGALAASPNAGEIEWFRVGPRGEELDHAQTPI